MGGFSGYLGVLGGPKRWHLAFLGSVGSLGGFGESSGGSAGSWEGYLGSLWVVFGLPKAPGEAFGLLGLQLGAAEGFGVQSCCGEDPESIL